MNSGKILLTLVALFTLVAPIVADWNQTHVFNPEWPPHARFHTVVGLCMSTGFSIIALWLLWGRPSSQEVSVKIVALVPILYWGSFFIAALVPGAWVEDHPGAIARIMGIPINLAAAGMMMVISAFGYWLYQRTYTPE